MLKFNYDINVDRCFISTEQFIPIIFSFANHSEEIRTASWGKMIVEKRSFNSITTMHRTTREISSSIRVQLEIHFNTNLVIISIVEAWQVKEPWEPLNSNTTRREKSHSRRIVGKFIGRRGNRSFHGRWKIQPGKSAVRSGGCISMRGTARC